MFLERIFDIERDPEGGRMFPFETVYIFNRLKCSTPSGSAVSI